MTLATEEAVVSLQQSVPHCPRTDGRYKKKNLEDHPRRLLDGCHLYWKDWESAERKFVDA